MNIFLYAPDDFKNLCVIARTLECFGFNKCYIYDRNHLVRLKYGKSYSNRIRTVSAGAFFLIQWEVISDPPEFVSQYAGRHIATLPIQNGIPIYGFSFLQSDLIIFGSERNGIPTEIQALCDAAVTIPLVGLTPSLNLSVAVSIVLAEMTRDSPIVGNHQEPAL
jgi:tRNA G18 (ribose-2'-O)-methylase SpoU